jgi:uncharacterized protein YbjT (DUF2867 family)
MLLVTGATGNVGRHLCRELHARGVEFRVLVRDAARADGLPDSAQRVVADLGEPDTLPAAFAHVERMFLLTPGIGLEHTANAVAAAREAGVRHIVHLSSVNVLGDPMPAIGRWHHAREEAVRGCGAAVTTLRPGGFMTNALAWAPTIRAGGFVLDPTGPGRIAPVDPADVAAVAALALTGDGHEHGRRDGDGHQHEGQAYVLTGDEALTVAEQVKLVADAIGRPIEVREARDAAEAVRSRFPDGGPQPLIDAMTQDFALLRADTVGLRTDTVERLLGRRPGGFADWCVRNADAFR